MRRYAPVEPPTALSIAGSDSGGGAGIQADLKTMEAHGVFGTSVVTAITAQNTLGVESSHVLPTDEIAAQYEAVAADFDVGAAKTGMLATVDVVETVTDCLGAYDGPVVVDPVMVAATGDRLLSPEAEAAYDELIARSTVVTPNADEATVLTDIEVDDETSAARAGKQLVDRGADAALVKGGHLGTDRVVDTLVIHAEDGYTVERFEHDRIDTDATHGSGCTLSSAIAARMARGEPLGEAVAAGVSFMQRAVRYGIDVGQGPGAVHHLSALRDRASYREIAGAVDAIESTLSAAVATGGADVPQTVDLVGCGPYAEHHEEAIARRWTDDADRGTDDADRRTDDADRRTDDADRRTDDADRRTDDPQDTASVDSATIEALFSARELEPTIRFAAGIPDGSAVEYPDSRLTEAATQCILGGKSTEASAGVDVEVSAIEPIVVSDDETGTLYILARSGEGIEQVIRAIE